MEFIVKQSKEKVDPRHPESTDPTHRAAAEKAHRNLGKMKFESEGQRRDYERSVKANPGNVMGAPAFFPPLAIKTVVVMPEVTEEQREAMMLERYRESRIRDEELFCRVCDRLTEFQLPACRCKTCGTRLFH